MGIYETEARFNLGRIKLGNRTTKEITDFDVSMDEVHPSVRRSRIMHQVYLLPLKEDEPFFCSHEVPFMPVNTDELVVGQCEDGKKGHCFQGSVSQHLFRDEINQVLKGRFYRWIPS